MCVLLIKRLLRLVGRWARKPVNHTSWVAVVTPTDRPKSVRNCCLIELFCSVVCVVTLRFWHFCWCRGFCHRTESDLFLFLWGMKYLKRSQNGMSPDTGMSATVGVPHIVLRDITKLSYVVSYDNTLWYRNADKLIQIKSCEVKVLGVLKDHKFVPNGCTISKCVTKNCKTCNILIIDNCFSSNLTKRSYSTRNFDELSCKSYNVVYAIECALCGLIYAG